MPQSGLQLGIRDSGTMSFSFSFSIVCGGATDQENVLRNCVEGGARVSLGGWVCVIGNTLVVPVIDGIP